MDLLGDPLGRPYASVVINFLISALFQCIAELHRLPQAVGADPGDVQAGRRLHGFHVVYIPGVNVDPVRADGGDRFRPELGGMQMDDAGARQAGVMHRLVGGHVQHHPAFRKRGQ